MPAAITSCQNGTILPASSTGKVTPSSARPSSNPVEIATITRAGGAEMDAAVDEVERAIEDVRPRHQHHARADRNKAQRGTQLVADRQGADDAGHERRAERLEEDVCARPRHAAPQNGAGRGTHEHQRRREWMLDAEDHR